MGEPRGLTARMPDLGAISADFGPSGGENRPEKRPQGPKIGHLDAFSMDIPSPQPPNLGAGQFSVSMNDILELHTNYELTTSSTTRRMCGFYQENEE